MRSRLLPNAKSSSVICTSVMDGNSMFMEDSVSRRSGICSRIQDEARMEVEGKCPIILNSLHEGLVKVPSPFQIEAQIIPCILPAQYILNGDRQETDDLNVKLCQWIGRVHVDAMAKYDVRKKMEEPALLVIHDT